MSNRINPEDYIYLGYKVVNAFLQKNQHLYDIIDDLEGEAMLAIVEAAARWENKGSIAFSTYCAIEVHNAILKYLRDNENRYHRIVAVSLEDIVLTPESETWEDLVEGSIVDIENTIDSLSDESREYISLVNKGYGKRKIRRILKIGWKQFSELEQRVIDELKENIK